MLPLVTQRILCPEAASASQVSSYCSLALSNLLDVINNSGGRFGTIKHGDVLHLAAWMVLDAKNWMAAGRKGLP